MLVGEGVLCVDVESIQQIADVDRVDAALEAVDDIAAKVR
jgi:hypothetical protein